MAFNSLHKLRDNIEAIRITQTYQPSDHISEAQAGALRKYAGFGGLKAILYPAGERSEWEKRNASKADLQLYPSMMELHQLLKDQLDEPAYRQTVLSLRDSVLTAFYTPDVIPQTLYAVLKEEGISPRRLYEPSNEASIIFFVVFFV